MEHLSSDIFKGQMERDAAGKLIYALFATVVWLFIVIGVVVIGPAILVIAFKSYTSHCVSLGFWRSETDYVGSSQSSGS